MISARYYYQLNTLEQDPQRDIQTSQLVKGGCGCGLKGGESKKGGELKKGGESKKGIKSQRKYVGKRGGSKKIGGNRKNHSRKYLRRGGNAGFFSNFGTTTGVSTVAAQITGTNVPPNFSLSTPPPKIIV